MPFNNEKVGCCGHFNNKWSNKYHLNAAKRENYTRRSGVRKEHRVDIVEKQVKKLFYTSFYTTLCRFCSGKDSKNVELTIRSIWYRNAVLSVLV